MTALVNAPALRGAIDEAAAALRAIVLAEPAGVFLGREEALVTRLGVSRATVRQVARLLEREGLLRVRRGLNGGYFGARPDVSTIEATVSAYLETLDMDAADVTVIASALWVEVIRKAAGLGTQAARETAGRLSKQVGALPEDASFAAVAAVEEACRTAIFALAKARYIELIFQINTAFAQRRFSSPAEPEAAVAQREFVRAWKAAKLLELGAIADADPELGAMAARRARNLWHERVWRRLAA